MALEISWYSHGLRDDQNRILAWPLHSGADGEMLHPCVSDRKMGLPINIGGHLDSALSRNEIVKESHFHSPILQQNPAPDTPLTTTPLDTVRVSRLQTPALGCFAARLDTTKAVPIFLRTRRNPAVRDQLKRLRSGNSKSAGLVGFAEQALEFLRGNSAKTPNSAAGYEVFGDIYHVEEEFPIVNEPSCLELRRTN
ncbi:uncharacterized protein BO80DRAFT_449970 [Aspergillus ibericus CBS 121593]|uniref:Uncharacterized protein n=1 Tax=Aspergillus ibericus CBS 121593 TaxID=1448316 RepID=A0A395GKS9_9EURO|nr:hypothetical protein BO80DRAFT_449970 [Aspergillus ibericus CBS 121593]RAK95658.1 hypothetical protein BO80DRAFT_449970 [Aspergillus ibericus CBS 121593]